MAAPNLPGSNIKIGIPHLTFESVSDLADKHIVEEQVSVIY